MMLDQCRLEVEQVDVLAAPAMNNCTTRLPWAEKRKVFWDEQYATLQYKTINFPWPLPLLWGRERVILDKM